MPIGCQTVLISRKASILAVPGGAAQSSSAANTRFTFPAASRASPARPSVATPVRMFTTPGGTSEVASTSASVTAGSGTVSLATTTAVLPVAITGASTLTSPSRPGAAGASTATTPVGSGTLKLKYGPATGLAAPATWPTLSGQPAYQTHRSIASATARSASARETPSFATDSSVNCAARPWSSSATRYRTCPRLYAVAPAQPATALRAATTASRASLREASATCASTAPSGPAAG